MKRLLSILLLTFILLSLTSCGSKTEPKDIKCEEIIKAYENSGYYVSCHRHAENDSEHIDGEYCYIIIHETEDENSDLAEIKTFNSKEAAKKAEKDTNYNIVIWMFSSVLGESRWLKSGQYGKIVYSSYNSSLLKPLEELIE